MLPGYPVRLSRMWFGLPTDFSHVDAAYERPSDGKIVFFRGNNALPLM